MSVKAACGWTVVQYRKNLGSVNTEDHGYPLFAMGADYNETRRASWKDRVNLLCSLIWYSWHYFKIKDVIEPYIIYRLANQQAILSWPKFIFRLSCLLL